ncbi:MAG TPA: peptidoglycan DD-metalloendopeptidase family protein [Chondromyces sp.]|nr:peptidoglycan DD-metalloendopeptidase family protein [Chondromyces sp.]
MQDYIRRFIIVLIMALCVSMLIIGGTMAQAAKERTGEGWVFPADGVISDVYGSRNGKHKAIDVAAETGTPVYSAGQGVVTKSYFSDTYGNAIFIKHESGYEAVYAHLDERGVEEGEKVEKGQVIGTVGNTGRSTGAHLHFELHLGEWTYDKDHAIDPALIFGQAVKGMYVAGNQSSPLDAVETASNLSAYMVKSGDTLWGIAAQYKTTVEKIQHTNQLKQTVIFPGQVLKVPLT